MNAQYQHFYTKPEVRILLPVSSDIVAASAQEPMLGEWDTEM